MFALLASEHLLDRLLTIRSQQIFAEHTVVLGTLAAECVRLTQQERDDVTVRKGSGELAALQSGYRFGQGADLSVGSSTVAVAGLCMCSLWLIPILFHKGKGLLP